MGTKIKRAHLLYVRICYLGPRKPKSSYLKPGIGTLSVVAIAGWVLTSHSPTHGGRGRQPDVHVLSTDYHRGHLDLLNCHWGGDFLDECLTAVLGCLLRYPTPVRTPSCLWLIWPTGTINLVPAKLGSVAPPFPSGTGSLPKHWECVSPFYWTWNLRGVVAVPHVLC